MANSNDRDIHNRENAPDNVPDPNIPHAVEPDPSNYREGYTQGRPVDQQRYEADQQVRDNDNAGRGLLVGLILAGTAALVGGGLYLLNQNNQTPAPVERTIVVPGAAPSPSPSPQVRERIIERDRLVPVPQAPAQAPKVNITIPQPQQSAPAAQPAPATQPAPAQSSPQPTSPANSAQPNSSSSPTNRGAESSPSSTTNPPGTGSGQ